MFLKSILRRNKVAYASVFTLDLSIESLYAVATSMLNTVTELSTRRAY